MIFFYHYNKPLSQKLKKPKLTLHYNNTCYPIDKVICNVPTFSHNRKIQPYIVIKGKSDRINIKDGIALIE